MISVIYLFHFEMQTDFATLQGIKQKLWMVLIVATVLKKNPPCLYISIIKNQQYFNFIPYKRFYPQGHGTFAKKFYVYTHM